MQFLSGNKQPGFSQAENLVLTNPNLIRTLLLRADYDTIINYCRTHTEGLQICRDKAFWERKVFYDFGIPQDVFENPELTPAQRYLQFYTEKGGVGEGSEKFIDWNEFVRRAIQQDKNYLVQYAHMHY